MKVPIISTSTTLIEAVKSLGAQFVTVALSTVVVDEIEVAGQRLAIPSSLGEVKEIRMPTKAPAN